MCPSRNPGAAQRAEAELIANPARSDRLVAQAAGCEHHTVGRTRKRLEAAGTIPAAQHRQPRHPPGPRQPGATQQALSRLGLDATTRQVMDAAGVDRSAVWWARRHRRPELQDVAAATDTLSVTRTVRWTKARACAPVPPSGYAAYAAGWERATPAALNVCLKWCPALRECRTWALAQPPADTRVYAGLTPQQRRAASGRPNGSVP